VRLAVCPVQTVHPSPAVVVCMDELMQGCGGDLAGGEELIMAKEDALLLGKASCGDLCRDGDTSVWKQGILKR